MARGSRLKVLGAIFLGIGVWFVYGFVVDWVGDQILRRLPEEDDGDRAARRQRYRRVATVEHIAEGMQRTTRRGLPWGVVSLLLGILLLLLDTS